MIEIKYGELERIIENIIASWARNNDIKEDDYNDEYSDFNYVDALLIASDITFDLFIRQDDGIKIVGDAK